MGAFEKRLADYSADLSAWLEAYAELAQERVRTFDLALVVESAARGAYAESVTLELKLPDGFRMLEEIPEMGQLPADPSYKPPKTIDPFRPMEMPGPFVPSRAFTPFDLASVISPRNSGWRETTGGVERDIGEVHHGRTIELGEPLLLQAPHEGTFEVRWAFYTKSRNRCRGSLQVVVPEASDRPAFTRLAGILAYPDLTFVDADGTERERRTSDPPLSPPESTERPSGDEPLIGTRLVEAAARRDWDKLGLADDSDQVSDAAAGPQA